MSIKEKFSLHVPAIVSKQVRNASKPIEWLATTAESLMYVRQAERLSRYLLNFYITEDWERLCNIHEL